MFVSSTIAAASRSALLTAAAVACISVVDAHAAPSASLPENVGPVVVVATPTATPTLPPGRQSCFIYQMRRGPGSNSRWRFGRDYPYYNAWSVWIPAPTDAQKAAMFSWECPPNFRSECGWWLNLGRGPGQVISGHYDPCNRCRGSSCSTCAASRYDMPASVEYPPGSGVRYQLMNRLFSEGGRCGTPECPCWLSGIVSPLVIDFKGKGLTYTADGEHVSFDLEGEGAMPTSWIKNGEDVAFIALDRSGDGVINGINELFGNETNGPDDRVPENGFDALRKYDLNKDDVINGSDAVFAKLLLWFDRNVDGKSTPNELHPVASKGVKSISLKVREVIQNKDPYGNMTRQSSDALLADGGTVAVHDVWFAPANPLSLRDNPGGRVATAPVPAIGEPNHDAMQKAWKKTAEQEGFGEGEMPFASGEIHTRLGANGNVEGRTVEWKHRLDTCRLVAEFDADWALKESYSACY